jgi:Iron-sulfur cluster-binding domain
MRSVTAILSMLHEEGAGSAANRFRDEPVLTWTLRRLQNSIHLSSCAILCWEDQAEAAKAAAQESGVTVSVRGSRVTVKELEATSAARRWADGWRGGLLGCCEFDRGFHGPWMEEVRASAKTEAIVLVDPAAGLVDARLIDAIVDHAEANPKLEMIFSQAAPGLAGVLITSTLLGRLAVGRINPGVLVTYRPDLPSHDPISDPACMPVDPPLARTLHRFSLDSQRQIARLSCALQQFNGELLGLPAERLLAAMNGQPRSDTLPREVVVELNVERASDPIFWPGKRPEIKRASLSVEMAKQLFAELAEADDMRVVLGGVGDPMLHEQVLEIAGSAREAGIRAISMETDFLGISPECAAHLAGAPIDIVSVHIPAARADTYTKIMGVDGLTEAMANLRAFLQRRQELGRATPLFVPTFVKCRDNLAEMEVWYDHWLRAVNCAVITGPSVFGGPIADVSAADMTPPRRKACARLQNRMTVLCDGTMVSCEQDVLGRQAIGRVGETSIRDAWRNLNKLRQDHDNGQWEKHPACVGCKEWHRP